MSDTVERLRKLMRTRRMLAIAMRASDTLVCRIEYIDSKQQRTMRIVSPIRFLGNEAVLALCTGRQEVRRFDVDRIEQIWLALSDEVLMPTNVEVL